MNCHFCGGNGLELKSEDGHHYVTCNQCHARGPLATSGVDAFSRYSFFGEDTQEQPSACLVCGEVREFRPGHGQVCWSCAKEKPDEGS